ncbi:HAUS augmin-like complex subunit 3 isoform X2 [Corticium candelabrum]|uniref:HAUS augmin-like complex subunit 3 isoform X2 n=1 Tax=Corticium candelabrum TaxID=121492 RepID=UPI002E26CA8E|nr:HAUS augmin-like complex subunit 3 isoform X2 [Corticium candelabrum]XP_062514915.1 HAUS augmin-like complex subunit 3 isoform X2 [Corticium candelabrum]
MRVEQTVSLAVWLSMCRHLSRIRKRNSELAPAIENAGQGMDKVLHKSWEDNSLINEAINDLEKSAHSLVALHTTIPDDKEQTSHFLAHQDFTHHEASENEYMERLTSYTKKQFFDGVAQLAGRKEGSRYELLNVGDPDSLLVKGESETVKAGYSRELARLQSVYALSQGQRIDALTARAKVNAACRSFNHQIESLDIEMIKDVQTLRTELEESQQKLAELKEETSQVTDTEMTPLLDELATLQQTCVLRGDYELKQARQDYFMSKQDKVIFYLLQQRGRHEFLSMALEREGRELRDSHRLLAATEAHLSAAVQTKEATELAMSHLNLKAPDQTRATLDSRDASMNRLFAMLELECKHGEKHQQQQLFSTYKQMLDNVTALQQQFDAIKSRTLATELTRQVYVSQLEQSLQQCLDLAFSNSKTITITEQLEKLNEIVGSLEKSIKEIVHSWNEKKKMVSSSPLLAAERELWVLFYTNTSKLRQIVADLGTRVQTHQH